MPAHWDSDAAWYQRAPRDGVDQGDSAAGGWGSGWGAREGGPPNDARRARRLWFPVLFSFLVQVPLVALLTWPGRQTDDHFGDMPMVHGAESGGAAGGFDASRGGFSDGIAGALFGDRPGLQLGSWLVAVMLAFIGPLALIGARRFPGPVVAVAAAAVGALVLLRPDLGVPPIALAVAIVLGIVRGARVWVYASVATAWVATIALAALFELDLPPLRIMAATLGLAVVMAAGEGIRNRRERFRDLRRTAAARQQTAEQRERVRIARELHDVLAHSLSQINVQAGVGLHLIDSQPERAAEALASIKSTSKNALEEVRTVLGILRSTPDGSTPDDGGAPLAPQPDLAGLPALIESFTRQGLAVEFAAAPALTGASPPAATQLALYRIVQEALTNVLRHARAATVRVELGCDATGYRLTVTDDGSLAPGAGPLLPGGGLLGMRERAELLGGSLHVHRVPVGQGGGVRVEAMIPVLPRRDSRPGSDPA
ncbi:sensor histidine kinase [Cryobacterium melibiosiphilum]|uniref:histidine kinase n=1 Tax=Cryobacterium melibiosiphilum TaxID=995039 RepID=A0A3A5MMU9_9MICO|nr:sensor histidine kinase [Cryobacterium melibiosiphilum]RJT90682.1 sensor histidine kinase [Cryobacterium melibiosiphilum]